jgi:hypothetical protein
MVTNMLEIAKIITIIWFYLASSFVLVAKVNNVKPMVALIIKFMTVISMVYFTLFLLNIVK